MRRSSRKLTLVGVQGASHGAGTVAGGLGPRDQERREPSDSGQRTITQLFGICLSEGKARGQSTD